MRSRGRDDAGDDRPVVVVSDLHLGRRGMVETAAELSPLVESASALVVNGDLAELLMNRWADAARRELDQLRDRCAAAGTRLVVLAGNHDPTLTDRRHLLLADERVLLTHGDAVHEALAPWSDAADVIRDRHREVMASLPESRRDSIEGIFEACREAALAECEAEGDLGPATTPLGALAKPWKVARILSFWWSQPRLLDRLAERHFPTAQIVISGHSHRAGVKRVGRRTIINTGCFGVPGPALAAVFDREGLVVRRVERRGRGRARGWSLDDVAIHREPGIMVDRRELPDDREPLQASA